jgi:TM2 domain-containing membrane protein YozV
MSDSELVELSNRKLAAGLLAIFLGSLGIHKFLLGYTNAGLIMLLVSLLTCGVGATVMWVIGIVEGITYLTKTPEEFRSIYIDGHKEWF